jgi:hypothetical protein
MPMLNRPAIGRTGVRGVSIVVAMACLGASIPGCSLPSEEPSFASADPVTRLAALREAVARGDRSAIPDLIGMLESDDPAHRMFAIRALEGFTGQTLGYDHAAPESERQAAVERWEAWWRAESGDGTVAGSGDLADHHAVAGATHPGTGVEPPDPSR